MPAHRQRGPSSALVVDVDLGRLRYRVSTWAPSRAADAALHGLHRAHALVFGRRFEPSVDEDELAADLRLAERAGLLEVELLGVFSSTPPEAEEAVVPLLSEPAKATEVELYWTEVAIIDADGKPIADVECSIELPDGRVHQGRTDGNGLLRVDGIQRPGSCTISFPTLHQARRSA